MEPGIIALICAAAFGGVVAIAAFVRQIILSRDKLLNDEAQRRAITQEAAELEKMREQMQSSKRFDSHYKVLGSNKDAIIYLDNKIEEILHKKTSLIERYSQLTLKESGAIVDGKISKDRKVACDRLKAEIDEEMKFYNEELISFQQRRTSLWDTHKDLQEYLLKQEQARNANLDAIYKQHSSLLEKIYLRHTDNAEHVATQSINAGTTTFKSIIMAPIHFLLQYFNLSSGISLSQAQVEQAARDDVDQMEKDVNDSEQKDDDLEQNNDKDSEQQKDSQEDEGEQAEISFARA
ncbi:hypothetical protein [Legionella sp. km772]|uniref:hypothetical protein n=1 Tax=Legionella sp. km772 TaxID=2498111 RepID=UPI000F8E8B48|nr:hypothetical protein [Legionella sp. km772]RUR11967.1 hypothetical protein ELY15_06590 [Legionella sp. km772]